MNIYEIQQGLREAKLRCAMLEADLEAERAVRKAQEKRLLKYRRIIDELMDGADNMVVDDDDTDDHVGSQETSEDEGPYRPQTPPANAKASSHSASPAVCRIRICLVLSQFVLS